MWNDIEIPLAYLITFRTYGTWLHGDARGSTSRFRNKYKTSHLPKEDQWLEINKSRLAEEPFTLGHEQRKCVEEAIRETCKKRSWNLHAINVRSNHAHTVVCIGLKKPHIALNAFKANATRALRESGLYHRDRTPWADKESERWLWNEKSVLAAIVYVNFGQGDDPTDFDLDPEIDM